LSYVTFSYYIYTVIKKPDTEALMAWANKKLGPSKCKRIKLVNRPKSDWMGMWDWNGEIMINMAQIGYRKKLYRILAHEWTHAQQYWRDYKKSLLTHSYWEHPLEVDARGRERTMEWRQPAFCKTKNFAK